MLIWVPVSFCVRLGELGPRRVSHSHDWIHMQVHCVLLGNYHLLNLVFISFFVQISQSYNVNYFVTFLFDGRCGILHFCLVLTHM